MRKNYVLALLLFLDFLNVEAQPGSMIPLPSPDLHKPLKSVMEAFAERKSVREFDTMSFQLSDLSQLLWAANGVNRPAEKKRTAPSAMNAQDIDIYVFTAKEVFLYDAFFHAIVSVVKGDFRQMLAAGQDFVKRALVVLLLVSNLERFPRGTDEQKKQWAAIDAGMVAQNIALYCSAAQWRTRPRAFMEVSQLKELLHLSAAQEPLLNLPVSY